MNSRNKRPTSSKLGGVRTLGRPMRLSEFYAETKGVPPQHQSRYMLERGPLPLSRRALGSSDNCGTYPASKDDGPS